MEKKGMNSGHVRVVRSGLSSLEGYEIEPEVSEHDSHEPVNVQISGIRKALNISKSRCAELEVELAKLKEQRFLEGPDWIIGKAMAERDRLSGYINRTSGVFPQSVNPMSIQACDAALQALEWLIEGVEDGDSSS